MDDIRIQWFPGHMAKAHRLIKEHLKLIDVVIELVDARIPYSSANPEIQEVTGAKPRVIVLNKADLAQPEGNESWLRSFRQKGLEAVLLEATTGKGAKQLVSKVEAVASAKMQAMAAKGIRQRAIRAMILGIPNVGKSSLINRLLGTATVKTGDKPGVTRGKQWIKIGNNLELLDTPGVLWPKFDDQEVAFRLAVTGAISDDVFDMEKVVLKLLVLLINKYPDRVAARFNLDEVPPDPHDLLLKLGAKRGCLRAGGIVDREKICRIIINEFRAGKLGPFTLDEPPQPEPKN
ncbi:MAG: ribosome biogenesis GTPase YlqF [Negativicutes bacterium]|nr:ribosome biogenesis GTPase YlqF [Negativicutes bacterium]